MRSGWLMATAGAALAVAAAWALIGAPPDAPPVRQADASRQGRSDPQATVAGVGARAGDGGPQAPLPWSRADAGALDARLRAALSARDYHRLNETVGFLMQQTSLSDAAKFDLLWQAYRDSRLSDPVGAQILLDSTMSLKLREQLPALVREFEDPQAPGWARARLLMLMGLQIRDAEGVPAEQAQRQNAQILALIARSVSDPDAAVAREATIGYARLATAAGDGQDVLDRALQRGLLSREAYLRESILRLPALADAGQQHRALEAIRAGSAGGDVSTMRTVVETVSVALQDARMVRTLDDTTRASLAKLLENQAPDPTSDASRYAMTAATGYYDWAVASGTLQGVPEQGIAQYLARLAGAPQTTPAQAAALMLSPRAAEIAQAASEAGSLPRLRASLESALRSTAPDTAARSVYEAALSAAAPR